MKKILICFILLGIQPFCYAENLDSLTKQISGELKQSQPIKTHTSNKKNVTTQQKTKVQTKAKTTSKTTSVPPVVIISGGDTYYRKDLYAESYRLQYFQRQIEENCKIYTQQTAPLVIEYKIVFYQNNIKNIQILKGTGDTSLDNEIVAKIKEIFASENCGILNNGNTLIFKGTLYTKPISQYTPIYQLTDDENSIINQIIPCEQREYFKQLNNKLNENYKNTSNTTGETIIFIKFNKNGELVSINQNDLLNEFNHICSTQLSKNQIPAIPDQMLNEILDSIERTFPIVPLNIKSNNVIIYKKYNAKHTGWIKKDDNVAKKVGKGFVIGIGEILKIPLEILTGDDL